MKTVLFERVQICEVVYSDKDVENFLAENPDSVEHDYYNYVMELIKDQDESWTSAEVFIIGHIEGIKE